LRSHPHLTGILFKTLAAKNIELFGISTSEIRLSILINQDFTELAVRTLHHAYGLEQSSQTPHLYAIA
ncbi:MAG: ACT domain-containing protein, partial [Patescibacteria group bacterium]|nr:ACT domain-containing protein [Patescibacteria group bacterium]